MKKLMLIASILASFNVAFANELNTEAMDNAQVEMAGSGDAIVGGIIGGIIGGVIGGVIADDHHHHRPAPRGVVCYARNARGETFRAFAQNSRRAQANAMEQCYRFSRNCRPVGCQY